MTEMASTAPAGSVTVLPAAARSQLSRPDPAGPGTTGRPSSTAASTSAPRAGEDRNQICERMGERLGLPAGERPHELAFLEYLARRAARSSAVSVISNRITGESRHAACRFIPIMIKVRQYHYPWRGNGKKHLPAADANREFSKLLRAVREGDSYTVTSHGKPVARIVPVQSGNGVRRAARGAAGAVACPAGSQCRPAGQGRAVRGRGVRVRARHQRPGIRRRY